jgi:hypothetical protein
MEKAVIAILTEDILRTKDEYARILRYMQTRIDFALDTGRVQERDGVDLEASARSLKVLSHTLAHYEQLLESAKGAQA